MSHPSHPETDTALAALLARPGAHLREVTALDRLGTVLRTAEPGTLVLLYAPVAAEADAIAVAATELYAESRADAMAADARIEPIVDVDAAFAKGALDLRFLFSTLMARLGAAPSSSQIPRSASPSERALWARGRRLQLRETADFHLAAVAECRGRSVEVVVIRHLERAGRRATDVLAGEGTETLVQFAAAAGIIVVLAGDYGVLEHRTTATAVEEVHVARYDPSEASDVAEFARVAQRELGDLLGEGLARDADTVEYLLVHTLGSVALLRAWTARARTLISSRGAGTDPYDALAEREPLSLVELQAAARRIRLAEQRLAQEAAITEADILALLAGATTEECAFAASSTGEVAGPRRHPDGLRPGERRLVDDPVGAIDVVAA